MKSFRLGLPLLLFISQTALANWECSVNCTNSEEQTCAAQVNIPSAESARDSLKEKLTGTCAINGCEVYQKMTCSDGQTEGARYDEKGNFVHGGAPSARADL